MYRREKNLRGSLKKTLSQDFWDDVIDESYTQLKERMEDKEREFVELRREFAEREAELIEVWNLKEIDLCQQLVDFQLEIESYKKQVVLLEEQQMQNSRTEQSFNNSLKQFNQVREKLEIERKNLKEKYIKIAEKYTLELQSKKELMDQLGLANLQDEKIKVNSNMSLRYALYETKKTNKELKKKVQDIGEMLIDSK